MEEEVVPTIDRNFQEINKNLANEISRMYSKLDSISQKLKQKYGDLYTLLNEIKNKVENLAWLSKNAIDKVLESRTEDFMTSTLKEQLKQVKNAFFMKTLRSIIVKDESL